MDEGLTRSILMKRINAFFNEKVDVEYFLKTRKTSIRSNLYDLYFHQYFIYNNKVDISTTKWKTYLYLMKCIFDHRKLHEIEDSRGIPESCRNPRELLEIIEFLEDERKQGDGKTKSTNKKWLADRLMDAQDREEDELWGSGEHEWLLRSLIIEVLKRSAGTYYPNIKAYEESYCIFSSLDWLMIQAELRSKTKYIFHENSNHSLESGHAGAIKKSSDNKGFITKGDKLFHNKLVEAFNASTTISGFLTRVENIIKTDIVSGKHPITPSRTASFLIDGTRTNNSDGIEKFRANKLYPDGYASTRLMFLGKKQRISQFEENGIENSAESLSESSSENEDKWMSSINTP